ncbi:MAG: hypothetical protein R3C68_05945 [Myxococcota bacterium]
MDHVPSALPAEHMRPPGRWPQWTAMILGCVCLIGAMFAWQEIGVATRQKEAVMQQISRASEVQDAESVQRALMRSHRAFVLQEANWRRRRLGLFLAAATLLVGGFFAAGIHRLYAKTDWAVVDDPEA